MAGLLLVWSIVIWDSQRTEDQAQENARRETAAWAMTFASQAQSIFVYTDHALLTLRNTWINHPADMGDVVRMHSDAQAGSIVQVGVIDARGYLVYSNLGLPKEPSFLGDREHFTVHQALMQDQLFVSRPVKGRVSGKWSIQLTRPIFQKGQFAGVIVASVDPDYFVRFYNATGFGRNGAARMVRDTGEIMARSSEQDKYVGKVIQPTPYADPGAPQQGSFRRKAQADGVERLSGYYRLPQYGLTVIVGSSVEDLLVPVREQQRKSFLAAGVVSVLLILVAALLIRSMARQMKAHQAVSESEERFRMIFDSLPIGISLADQKGYLVDCNAAAEKLFGVNKAQFAARDPGWKVFRLDGTPMPPGELATERALNEHRAVLDVSMEIQTPNGRRLWLSANATPVEHPDYGVVGAFVGHQRPGAWRRAKTRQVTGKPPARSSG